MPGSGPENRLTQAAERFLCGIWFANLVLGKANINVQIAQYPYAKGISRPGQD